jgi:LEA14-like dessication related protein
VGSRESGRKNKSAGIICFFLIVLPVSTALSGCTLVDYTVPIAGMYDSASVVVKNFILVDTITVHAEEKHTISPFGIKRTVEGAKVTYSDLILEAAKVNADDIINVRIDMQTTGKTTIADWVKGWERTFIYTGQALAIKYTDNKNETDGQEIARF